MSGHQSMQCPRCGSYHTQSVKIAYTQAVRTGESGYTTISDFGRSIAPPPPSGAIWIPIGLAAFTAVALMAVLPEIHRLVPLGWLQHLSSFGLPVLIVSILVGILAGLWAGAKLYIPIEISHRDELRRWARGVVCRRCGHRFRR